MFLLLGEHPAGAQRLNAATSAYVAPTSPAGAIGRIDQAHVGCAVSSSTVIRGGWATCERPRTCSAYVQPIVRGDGDPHQ